MPLQLAQMIVPTYDRVKSSGRAAIAAGVSGQFAGKE